MNLRNELEEMPEFENPKSLVRIVWAIFNTLWALSWHHDELKRVVAYRLSKDDLKQIEAQLQLLVERSGEGAKLHTEGEPCNCPRGTHMNCVYWQNTFTGL